MIKTARIVNCKTKECVSIMRGKASCQASSCDTYGKFLFIRVTGVQHAKGGTDGAIGVANNGELDFDFVFAVRHDILEPVGVGLDRVDRESGHKAIHRFEFVVLESQATNLRRTDGSEICVVRNGVRG